MEFFEELDNYIYPPIVIPIISPADCDEGAYVSFPKGNKLVGSHASVFGFRGGCRK